MSIKPEFRDQKKLENLLGQIKEYVDCFAFIGFDLEGKSFTLINAKTRLHHLGLQQLNSEFSKSIESPSPVLITGVETDEV